MINLPPTGLVTPLYPWIFWVLWTSRNQLLFEDKSFSETERMLKAIKAAVKWQEATNLLTATRLPTKKPNSVSLKDCPLMNLTPQIPANTSALYTDAAWNRTSLAGGMGWVSTKAGGSVLFKGTVTRRNVASALVAEAMALKTALLEAVSHGLTDIICFSDSKCLIDLITRKKTVVALQGLLHDLGVLSDSCNSISFCFIPRGRNEVADSLAKNALFCLSNNPSGNNFSVVNSVFKLI
ncbi:uncharacterized protein LOC125578086 [Brassica napus]|uniref:uncharacterized protein LOC125578086 n=1 Tax=Brassica napus TaxID=3708 RepID=UPI002078FF96|nr:uncharacterized protein LOC125578086 [Brassica napus]